MFKFKNIYTFTLFLFFLNYDLSALVRCQSAPVGQVRDCFESLSTANRFDEVSGDSYCSDDFRRFLFGVDIDLIDLVEINYSTIEFKINTDSFIAVIQLVILETFPLEPPLIRVISPVFKKSMNIGSNGAILHTDLTPLGWNYSFDFRYIHLILEDIIKYAQVDIATDNYYTEDGAKNDLDLYFKQLGF
jgi:hypothetical protein